MSSWQQVTVTGYATEGELKYMQSGQAVFNFSVPVNERWTGGDGEKREKTQWFRVSVFGKQAETCNQYVKKGNLVTVFGTVEVRVYMDKNNQPAASLDLRARDVRFLGSGANAGAGDGDNRELDGGGIPF